MANESNATCNATVLVEEAWTASTRHGDIGWGPWIHGSSDTASEHCWRLGAIIYTLRCQQQEEA